VRALFPDHPHRRAMVRKRLEHSDAKGETWEKLDGNGTRLKNKESNFDLNMVGF